MNNTISRTRKALKRAHLRPLVDNNTHAPWTNTHTNKQQTHDHITSLAEVTVRIICIHLVLPTTSCFLWPGEKGLGLALQTAVVDCPVVRVSACLCCPKNHVQVFFSQETIQFPLTFFSCCLPLSLLKILILHKTKSHILMLSVEQAGQSYCYPTNKITTYDTQMQWITSLEANRFM